MRVMVRGVVTLLPILAALGCTPGVGLDQLEGGHPDVEFAEGDSVVADDLGEDARSDVEAAADADGDVDHEADAIGDAPADGGDTRPVCPDDRDCTGRVCGPDPVCETWCGNCGPHEFCTDEGTCSCTGTGTGWAGCDGLVLWRCRDGVVQTYDCGEMSCDVTGPPVYCCRDYYGWGCNCTYPCP